MSGVDPTVLPAVKRELRERLQADDQLEHVDVVVGEDTDSEKLIVIGIGRTTFRFYGLGTRVPLREDEPRIDCLVQVVTRDTKEDYLDIEDEAARILGRITQLLRDDPHLGGKWQNGRTIDVQITSGPIPNGRMAQANFALVGQARHH